MKNKKVLIIIAIILTVLLILGVTAYFIVKNNNENKQQQTEIQNVDKSEDAKTTENGEANSLIDMNNIENVKIENGSKINNSEELLKDKILIGLRFTNIKLVAENGLTNFTADVENVSGSNFVGRTIIIVFKTADGAEYSRLEGYLPDIENGEANKIDASTTADLSNAYDFIVE